MTALYMVHLNDVSPKKVYWVERGQLEVFIAVLVDNRHCDLTIIRDDSASASRE